MREMLVAIPENLAELARRVLAEIESPRAKRAGAAVLALHGELGAGKTAFTQELAKALGVAEYVTSPTFVIMRLYPIKTHDFFKTLAHIDAYRVESPDEMRVLGLENLMREPTNLVCIEWAKRIKGAIPQDALHITFTYDSRAPSGSSRTVTYG